MIFVKSWLRLIYCCWKTNKRMSNNLWETCCSFIKKIYHLKEKFKIPSRSSLKCIWSWVKYTWKEKLKILKLSLEFMSNLLSPTNNLIWTLKSYKSNLLSTRIRKVKISKYQSSTKIEAITCLWRKMFVLLKKMRKKLKNKKVQYQNRWKATCQR